MALNARATLADATDLFLICSANRNASVVRKVSLTSFTDAIDRINRIVKVYKNASHSPGLTSEIASEGDENEAVQGWRHLFS